MHLRWGGVRKGACMGAQLPLNPGPNPTGRPLSDVQRGCHMSRGSYSRHYFKSPLWRCSIPTEQDGLTGVFLARKFSQQPSALIWNLQLYQRQGRRYILKEVVILTIFLGGISPTNVASWLNLPSDDDGWAPVSLRTLRPEPGGQPVHHPQHRRDTGI